jgi:hypothetical protein
VDHGADHGSDQYSIGLALAARCSPLERILMCDGATLTASREASKILREMAI